MSGDDPFYEVPEEWELSVGRIIPTAKNGEDSAELESEVFRTTFDRQTESVGMAVVSTVAAVSNTDPKEMEPLHHVIDTDALDAVFHPGSHGRATFSYSGYEVTVRSDGEITVAPDGN